MGEILKQATLHNIWFIILSLISVGLLIASFCLPPTGIIHASVLEAVAEIFAFGALGAVYKAIDKGAKAKIVHGNTNLILNDGEKD